ncbi:MAG: nucleotide sugar dehydrogenase [Chloroflexi bacterium]|nr:nucleotide sugar dehydrogenase [Chloroflexota bacterium]
MTNSDMLFQQIQDLTARIGVIGLGYVGLPLATTFAQNGYSVLGVDVDRNKLSRLARDESYIQDVPSSVVASLRAAEKFTATDDYAALRACEVVFICVPTPMTHQKAPDMTYIESAARGIAGQLRPGQLVILQSTTYPGTTEEFVLPILNATGLQVGKDFFLAFSPERIDPGHTNSKGYDVANTPKVVGGVTPACTRLAAALLGHFTAKVHVVSSPRAAEMCKLLENTFRSVNIALVNELALLCERMGIDIWEVVDAARTKPYGYMPFYPGAGVGGHCIPVDPYYLSWKAREYDFFTRFIEFAADTNQVMPYHVVDLMTQALNRARKRLADSRVLVLGVAFKPNIDDARNSPAERIIELLVQAGAVVEYSDPFVPQFHAGEDVFHREPIVLNSVPLTQEALAACDCAVIVSAHNAFDYAQIVANAPLIVDTANATRHIQEHREKIVRVGAPL